MRLPLQSITAVCLLLLSLLAGYTQTPEENADNYIKDLASRGKFSGAVLVAQNGNILFCKGYGYADASKKILISPDNEFRIGSVTKPFVSVLVMQLVEQKKIALDERIDRFFPHLEAAKKEITIKQLLQQTSGMEDYTEDTNFICPAFSHHPIDPNKMMDCMNNLKLEFAPGSKFSYSNTNYYLLGIILEKITGEPFEQLLKRKILLPLGMSHTGYKNISPDKLAQGYTIKDNKLMPTTTPDIGIAYSAGGMFSTVGDLYLFDRALRTDKLLKKSTLKALFSENKTVEPSYYGLGWYVDPGGHYRTFHEGGIDGFSSCFDRYLDNDLCIVALSNFEFAECRADLTEPLTQLFTKMKESK